MTLKELRRVIFDNICVYEISRQQGSCYDDLYNGKASALPQQLNDRVINTIAVHQGVLDIMVE